MKNFALLCLSVLLVGHTFGQDFLNNDLNGIVGSPSLPTGWQNVPFTDVNCLASENLTATTDLTDLTGPIATNGVMGNPYSGATFVSGLFGGGPGFFFHEGIMQEVSGFTVGGCYTVNFHQTVVKQSMTDYLDPSGAWAVYLDDDLIGISAPTVSNEPYISTNMPWEFRTMNFVATATTHTIKFLPADDDPDQSIDTPTSGLRMGIDSIYLGTTGIAPLVVDLGNDSTLCTGHNLVLDATNTNATYLWQDGSTGATLNVSIPPLQEVTYWVEVTGSCGSVSDSVRLYYVETPTVELGTDTLLCFGETLHLEVLNEGGPVIWQDGSSETFLTISEPGTYWAQAISVCGIITDTIDVSYGPRPVVDLGTDTALCDGETVSFDATFTNATYLWQDNSTASTLNVSEQEIYWVQVTAGCGSTIDSVTVIANPPPVVDLGQDTSVCKGVSLVLDATTSNASYLWQDNSTEPTFDVKEPGLYWVQLSTDCGVAQDSILIGLLPAPTVNLGSDTALCEEQSLLLDISTPNATYLWQDGSDDSNLLVTKPGIYWVVLTTTCSATDTIVVQPAICEVSLEIPNVITPNGDALNDHFRPRNSEGIISMTTEIYNRWGLKVFHTEDPLIDWSANETSAGVYYWIIEYATINGTRGRKHGYLTVLH